MHNNVVYPSLKRFVRNGWVKQSNVPGDRGQQRKQYSITPAGRKYLLEQLASFGDREAGEDRAFLLRVAFFGILPKEKCQAILAARKSFLTSRAGELSELGGMVTSGSFWAVALDRVRIVVEGELRWIRQLEQTLARRRTKEATC